MYSRRPWRWSEGWCAACHARGAFGKAPRAPRAARPPSTCTRLERLAEILHQNVQRLGRSNPGCGALTGRVFAGAGQATAPTPWAAIRAYAADQAGEAAAGRGASTPLRSRRGHGAPLPRILALTPCTHAGPRRTASVDARYRRYAAWCEERGQALGTAVHAAQNETVAILRTIVGRDGARQTPI